MNQTQLDEISKILHTSGDVKSFYQHFLAVSASMCGAQVGVAWRGGTTPFQPICQVHAQSAPTPKLSISERRHSELLQRAEKSESAFIVLPKPDADDPPLLFGAIRRDTETELVEFVLPKSNDEDRHREIVQTLDSFCAVADNFREKPGQLAHSDATHSTGRQPLTVNEIGQYAHEIHGSINPQETANRISNEVRRLLNCDRVSVLLPQSRLLKSNKYRIVSISGQPSVNRRSNAVKLLTVLANRTLNTEQRFFYPTETEAPLPPQIESSIDDYFEIAATRSLAIIPLLNRQPSEEQTSKTTGEQASPAVIAGLVIEHCREEWKQTEIAPAIDSAALHAGDAMRNALEHKQLFLYPLWRVLGQSSVVLAARNLPKTLLAIGAAALLAIALCFIPANFTLTCDGILQPENRARIYAGTDGRVETISIKHGQPVKSGDPLLRLANEDMAVELETIDSEIERQQQRLQKNRTARSNRRDTERTGAIDDNAASIAAQLDTLKRRREILATKSGKLEITAPIDGHVITWGVEDRLKDRPVSPGQALLEVVSIDGEWQLELELPDRRVGHFLDASKRHSDKNESGLEVSYQLASEPGITFRGRVVEFSRASRLTIDQQQTVRVKVAVDTDDIKNLKHVGSGVSAKIHCGRRSLGYVWLHDIYEFVQAKVLFHIW